MEERKHIQLNDIDAYKVAFNLSNYIWARAERWEPLAKNTVGAQYTKAVDSISANIAEGFGRYRKRRRSNYLGMLDVLCMNAWIGMKSVKSGSY